MPRKKSLPHNPSSDIIRVVGVFLVALGTPSLFLFKILGWSCIWLGKTTVGLLRTLVVLLSRLPLFCRTLVLTKKRQLEKQIDLLVEKGRQTRATLNLLRRKHAFPRVSVIGPKRSSKKNQPLFQKVRTVGKIARDFLKEGLTTWQRQVKTIKKQREKISTVFWQKSRRLSVIPHISVPALSLPVSLNSTLRSAVSATTPRFLALFAKKDLAPRKRGRKAKSPAITFKQRFGYLGMGIGLCFVLVFIPFWIKSTLNEMPSPLALTAREIPIATKIYDRNGVLLYQFYADENRTLVALNTLPSYVIDATIAIEDKNFYRHVGFDPQGIVRAAIANSNGEIVQGGSTITQQLIKSALLTPKQSIDRKLKEVVLSIWTERTYSKQQILEMYFNQVAYGGTAYGIKSAAQIYFNKEPKDLTLAEAALLAGLPNSPSNYSPFGPHPELSKERQHQVLKAMAAQGYITAQQADEAQQETLHFVSPETSIKAPHFVMYVKDYLTQKYGNRLVERGGLEVTTSLDYTLYEEASRIVKEGVDKQSYLNVGNAAALVTNPSTGEILAMVGSRDFFDISRDGNVNVTLSPRSPGSSIKPLTFALALEKGIFTPSSIISDTLTSFKIPGSAPYVPRNYDGKTSGNVTIRTALARSLNIPAVKVLEKVGVPAFIEFAQKLGITTLSDPNRFGLSLTLGGGEVLMTNMATAYSSFANGGEKVELKPVLLVKDYRGNTLEDNRKSVRKDRVMSSQTAFLISDILSDDNARAGTFGRGSILNIPNHTVAVKTGTTDDKRDNWTIGYTPNYLVAVWVGNNDNSRMSPALESGNTGAAAIWNPIFTTILKDKPNQGFARPENVIAVQVCALNGLLPCSNCPVIRTEYFQKGTEPTKACTISKEELEKQTKPSEQGVN